MKTRSAPAQNTLPCPLMTRALASSCPDKDSKEGPQLIQHLRIQCIPLFRPVQPEPAHLVLYGEFDGLEIHFWLILHPVDPCFGVWIRFIERHGNSHGHNFPGIQGIDDAIIPEP